jgi:hypothetical protein
VEPGQIERGDQGLSNQDAGKRAAQTEKEIAVRVSEAALDKERLGVELAAREGRPARYRD